MNNVLLIGSKAFTASVIAQVRGLPALSVTTATTASQASEVMVNALPDVVITEARCLIEGSVSKTFPETRSSVYFVVIERAQSLIKEVESLAIGHSALTPYAASPQSGRDPTLAPCIRDSFSVSVHSLEQLPALYVEALSEHYIEKKVMALEAGADAYLWLLPDTAQIAVTEIETSEIDTSKIKVSETNASEIPGTDRGSSNQELISFRPSQRRLLQAYVHLGLNRAQRYRDLSRINDWLSAVALVDALTQLSNRRAFDLELPRQIKVARTKGTPLCLMVLDIDRFKAINDRHGHLIGDDVLRLLAKRLLANMRFYDTPFRYGGEEFVVTLSSTALFEATAIADRLRQSIAKEPFYLSHPLIDTTPWLAVTVSIGITQLAAEDDEQGHSLLHRADKNLLKAKTLGRNRIVST